MKKGLKALSAVLALSMGLVGANLVSAYRGPSNEITKEAFAFLLPEKTDESVNRFYTGLDKDALNRTLKEAKEAMEALEGDVNVYTKINTAVCNAAQAIESIQNELRASAELRALAETYRANGPDVELGTKFKAALEKDTEIKKALTAKMFGSKRAEFERDLKAYNALKGKTDKETVGAYKDTLFDLDKTGESVKKTKNDLRESLHNTAKIINSTEYQDAAERVAMYTEKLANGRVSKLKGELYNFKMLIEIGKQILKDHHLALDLCELPEGLDLAAADKKTVAKKDSLPNTAAAGVVTQVKVYYFRALVPCACEKKMAKHEEMKSLFTFEQLKALDLVPVCCKKVEKAAKPEMKSAFTFEGLRNLDLVPCCR